MSDHVFVVSEWLAVEGKDEELRGLFKALINKSKEEDGCIRAHVTRQISHPGSPGKSKFTIVLLQEYVSIEAFDQHCAAEYVTRFFEKYIENENAGLIADWTCRLFSDAE